MSVSAQEAITLTSSTNRGRPRISDGRPFWDISLEEKIERWARVAVVLRKMSKHAIEHHFDMSSWMRVTSCGTVGCAAFQCALDLWFKRRGFGALVNKERGEWNWTGAAPATFFGSEGYYRVFTNDDIMQHGRRNKYGGRKDRTPRQQHRLALRATNQYLKSLKAAHGHQQ